MNRHNRLDIPPLFLLLWFHSIRDVQTLVAHPAQEWSLFSRQPKLCRFLVDLVLDSRPEGRGRGNRMFTCDGDVDCRGPQNTLFVGLPPR